MSLKKTKKQLNENELLLFFQKSIIGKNFKSSKYMLEDILKSKKSVDFAIAESSEKITYKKIYQSNMIQLSKKVKYKLLIGNGQGDIECPYQFSENKNLETGVNKKINQTTIIHPVILRPYIPGSSIHGAFRSYLVLKYHLNEDVLNILFGQMNNGDTHIGLIRCFDAHCDTNDALEVSIIKVEGSSTPLNFIHVKKGVEFTFNVSLTNMTINTELLTTAFGMSAVHNNIRDIITSLFNDFLNNGSIGARESVGWGEFEDVTEN